MIRPHHVAGVGKGSRSSILRPARFHDAEIFVVVLVASNYTHTEATWTQTLSDWIGRTCRMLRFLGGGSHAARRSA